MLEWLSLEVGGRTSDVGKKEEGGLDPCLTFQRANKGLLSVLEELETLEEEFPDVDEGWGPLEPVEI